jgi:hypothetical protein
LPIYYPAKKLDALDNPIGIMNVNNPMLLKIVWAAVSVLVIVEEIKVNISKAHQLITFNKNDCHPYLFISENPSQLQTFKWFKGTKLYCKSLSNIAKIDVINALIKKWIEVNIAIPTNFKSKYTDSKLANIKCIIDAMTIE